MGGSNWDDRAPKRVRTIAVNFPANIVPTKVRLNDQGDFPYALDNPNRWAFICPADQKAFNLHVTGASGFKDFSTVVQVPDNGVDIIMRPWPNAANKQQVLVGPMESESFFAPETMPFQFIGTEMFRNGTVAAIRGYTMFLHFMRHFAGQDVATDISILRKYGVNMVRNFIAGVTWGSDFAPGIEALDMNPWTNQGAWKAGMAKYFQMMTDAGIFVEATVVTRDDGINWYGIIQDVLDVAKDFGGKVFVEKHNEPWTRGLDVLALDRGINNYDVPWAYGIQPDAVGEDYVPCPHGIYGTAHLPRDPAHIHNGRDILRMMDAMGCVWGSDEPIAFADFERSGGGARTKDERLIWSHHAIARLFSPWNTAHSQRGLEGKVQDPNSDAEKIMLGISKIWEFIPDEVYTWKYVRAGAGGGDFPCVYNNGDSDVNHAYGKVDGGRAYVVLPVPTSQWSGQLVPQGDWKLDAVGPTPYIARFVK